MMSLMYRAGLRQLRSARKIAFFLGQAGSGGKEHRIVSVGTGAESEGGTSSGIVVRSLTFLPVPEYRLKDYKLMVYLWFEAT